MDWSASFGWILAASFGIGALHALEPGHGKSIMGAYLVASRGGVRHALLLGVVVTITHTFIVYLLAAVALILADRYASEQVTHWLEIVSGIIVLAVGIWMILTSFGLVRRGAGGHGHAHPRSGDHPHDHDSGTSDHDLGHADEETHQGHSRSVAMAPGANPLGLWTLVAVGTSGGLVPCPAAIAALLAAVNLGRPVAGIAVVGAMSLGIAATLIAIGVLFVQAARVATGFFKSNRLAVYIPRGSAILITVLGMVLLLRSIFGFGH